MCPYSKRGLISLLLNEWGLRVLIAPGVLRPSGLSAAPVASLPESLTTEELGAVRVI